MSDTPIRIGQRDDSGPQNICGSCEGISVSTSKGLANRPHLTALHYRTGDHTAFKASMITALSTSGYAALSNLKTRDDDDFSIALIDAWASVCEVLSFYQERAANEAYMETATERLSIGEIARLIGYRLHPGAAAEADLVLTLDDPPGAEPDVVQSVIPAGTRVQSQPGPDETPQTFETLDDLPARVSWNRLSPQIADYRAPRNGDKTLWLDGLATGLNIGDAVLIISPQRLSSSASTLWAMRRVTGVYPDAKSNKTQVMWDQSVPSLSPAEETDQAGHKFYVLKERGSLFGYNAPHPKVFSSDQLSNFGFDSPPDDWSFTVDADDRRLDLDVVYKGFVKDSWVAVTTPGDAPNIYRVTDAVDDGQSNYAISGRSSRLTLDTDTNLDILSSAYRSVSVYGNSQEIPIATAPLTDWIRGSDVILDRLTDLPDGRRMIVQGRRAQVRSRTALLSLVPETGTPREIPINTRLTVIGQPLPFLFWILWTLQDADGFTGRVISFANAFEQVPADETADLIAETAILLSKTDVDPAHTKLTFKQVLSATYDRDSFILFGNVAAASHGEGTSEILGSGNPAEIFQRFLLKQNPVTQRLAATEIGIESTLSIRVDGVEWTEKPDLYDRGPTARDYTATLTDTGETIIQFGDGLSGARLQPGRDNIVASYRRGLGRAGNVRKRQLSLLLDRPLGLTDAINPLPASGGDDPESAADARRNAPIYTLTLGRVVSLTDYRDFALGFPGIAKADARWIWSGVSRRIIVTVAGLDGAVLTKSGPTLPALLAAYKKLGDPLVQVDTVSYQPSFFKIALKVSVQSAYVPADILAAVEAALRNEFSFDRRGFAEKVALSDIAAIAHMVPGVSAVDIDKLYRQSGPQSTLEPHTQLNAQGARLGDGGAFLPAEILTLSPDPFDALVVMS